MKTIDRLTLERCELEKEIKQLKRALRRLLKWSDVVQYDNHDSVMSKDFRYAEKILKEGGGKH